MRETSTRLSDHGARLSLSGHRYICILVCLLLFQCVDLELRSLVVNAIHTTRAMQHGSCCASWYICSSI